MVKHEAIVVRISIVTREHGGTLSDAFSEGVLMPAVPRIGDEMTYRVTDASRLSLDTRRRIGDGVWIYKVRNVRWSSEDPRGVDIFVERE